MINSLAWFVKFYFTFNEAITALKLSKPASRFSTISKASSFSKILYNRRAKYISCYKSYGTWSHWFEEV